MTISKRIRFEVLKRDGFKCSYCGKSPPEVILEVDHINPESKGGKDDINNLITACFDCNRGKSNITLNKIPNQMVENLEILKLKDEQLKEYQKYIRKSEKKLNKNVNKIEKIFQDTYPGFFLSENFKEGTVKVFLKKHLPLEEVEEAMQIACSYEFGKGELDDCLKYFCGVCWQKVRNKGKIP